MQTDIAKLFGDHAAALAKLTGNVSDLLAAMEIDRRRRVWMPFSSGAPLQDCMVYRGPVLLRFVAAYSVNAGTVYLQAHNAASPEPERNPPDIPPIACPTLSTGFFDPGEDGILFSTGLYLCSSTTDVMKTLSLTKDLFLYALWRPI